MNRYRVGAFPSNGVPRLLVAIVGIPAILLGLLLMHVLASDTGATVTTSSVTAVASSSTGSESSQDALPPSAPQHSLEELACILALLVGMILLAIPGLVSEWSDRAGALLRAVVSGTVTHPPRPLLHFLSISRT